MSYLDLFFGLIIAWGAYSGFSKGLIKELASIVGVIAMNVIYNIGDAINKIGFGMAVWYAAKS